MSGMPFHLQGKGGLDIVDIATFASICAQQETWKQKQQLQQQEVNSFASTEPTSVLHMRRSPSPPTSASTLSSSFNNGGGGGNSTDNTTTTATEKVVNPLNNERKDEWATELQPIPSGLEISAGERCGVGLEDWENMFSEPNQEQSLLRWIAGDVDESFGLRQLLQGGNNPGEFDGNGTAGLGIVDHAPGFEAMTAIASGVSSIATNLSSFPTSGYSSITSGSNNGNGKLGSCLVSPPSSSFTSGSVNFISVGLGSNSSSNCSIQNPIFGSSPSSVSLPGALPPGMVYHHNLQHQIEAPEEKPQILNPQVLMNQQQSQNSNFFLPLPFPQQENHLLQPQTKRHNSGGMDPMPQMISKLPFSDPGYELLLRKQQHMGFQQGVHFLHPHLQQKPLVVKKEVGGGHQQQQQAQHQHALLDQLYKAAELVGTGNFSHAQGILARLNQQLSPIGKPLHRAAFYFKEALQLLLLMNNNPVTSLPPRSPTPFDVIFKLGAYKVFSEVSPLIQFVNFTCNQALLEALSEADRIHIIDFDIGFGAQWASFMQELPRNRGAPSLKITAFASPSTHHPVEVLLMRENLTQFANEIGISFELDVINFDSLEQSCYSLPIFRSKENEAIAVHFPVWSASNQPAALPSLLRFVKQLSPKIVVSLDRGDRTDLPFPQHILHALQSHILLLESLDAVNVASDAVNKIEKFLLQPRIESTVLGRLRAPDKMPTWKTIFASAGFSPVTFSNFTETQAECVVKRTPVRGFHVEKRQASLVLCWQRRDLISASAWRC
ncbi:scarecrow-like protein 27 [Ricinus communis]|uniref:scarecrow-like protein 27 n=1 Tax=Ricinus communis TaxID=3988 RepID=UPI0007721F3A|nr:scarecrow-like protein 27 [Ricinus communis]|eukprot:XP_015580706.1 scarecrow-like protein 27 [Ricinus communis]